MANKKYRVNVAFQSDKTVVVSAKNAREAKKKAHDRVAKMNIGKSIRKDWTEVDEY